MSDIEKQEGQKTVVAFIAGLLIGGLLVWVFSAAPEQEAVEVVVDETGTTETDTTKEADVAETDTTTKTDTPKEVVVSENGAVVVSNQSAGSVVALDSIEYPTTDGWIAVRDYIDGVPGRILGAARYSTEVGLTPEEVNLLRATEAGKTYQVVFFTENGDRVFDLADDVEMEAKTTIFTAK